MSVKVTGFRRTHFRLQMKLADELSQLLLLVVYRLLHLLDLVEQLEPLPLQLVVLVFVSCESTRW